LSKGGAGFRAREDDGREPGQAIGMSAVSRARARREMTDILRKFNVAPEERWQKESGYIRNSPQQFEGKQAIS
jgi:hypothetical protein